MTASTSASAEDPCGSHGYTAKLLAALDWMAVLGRHRYPGHEAGASAL